MRVVRFSKYESNLGSMLNVSKERVEEARQSCCNNEWLNGDAVHMLVEQAIIAHGEAAHVIAPGSSTFFFASHSTVWEGHCRSGDTLLHIESQLSKQVAITAASAA